MKNRVIPPNEMEQDETRRRQDTAEESNRRTSIKDKDKQTGMNPRRVERQDGNERKEREEGRVTMGNVLTAEASKETRCKIVP